MHPTKVYSPNGERGEFRRRRLGGFLRGSPRTFAKIAQNAATAVTRLTGNVNGPAMQVVNNNAGANDTALDLGVQPGEAP